jgi:hypothetical protein
VEDLPVEAGAAEMEGQEGLQAEEAAVADRVH